MISVTATSSLSWGAFLEDGAASRGGRGTSICECQAVPCNSQAKAVQSKGGAEKEADKCSKGNITFPCYAFDIILPMHILLQELNILTAISS